MKTKYKFILLVFVACICSIWIYYSVDAVEKADLIIEKYNIVIKIEETRFVVTGNFNKSDDVELILDSLFDKKVYKLTTGNNLTVTKTIEENKIKGKFYIYMRINDVIYDFDNYIYFK